MSMIAWVAETAESIPKKENEEKFNGCKCVCAHRKLNEDISHIISILDVSDKRSNVENFVSPIK